MKNEISKIILLIISDIILIFLTILFYNFVLKNNINNAQAIEINNSESTTVLITHLINWKYIIIYLLFITTINLIIISIINIIEYKNITNVPLKYTIIIIIAFDIISLIFLFPSMTMKLISIILKLRIIKGK